jgi:hypothetical protein
MLLVCMMRCLCLGDNMGEEDVDEVREHVVGKATLEMVDLRLGFATEEVGEGAIDRSSSASASAEEGPDDSSICGDNHSEWERMV